jgi:hypothetical protein
VLTVACVNHNDYLGMGDEYVDRLRTRVGWNLTYPHSFRILTEKDIPEGITGWWAKLALFKPGMFDPGERIVYIDLDTVIVGNIDFLAEYDGEFAALKDFYEHPHMNSAIMAWEAGTLDHIWQGWTRAGRPQWDKRGDQRFIEAMQPERDQWQDMHPGKIVSYKGDVRKTGKVPEAASIICFHGAPRPHEVDEIWNRKD